MVFKPYTPGSFRKKRVVFAETDIEPGLEAASTLAHQDRPAGDDVAVVALDAETLRIAVSPVARTALSFFMSLGVSVSVCSSPGGSA